MDVFASPSWYDALTLRERWSALRADPAAPAPDDGAGDGAPRLDAWRGQPPFDRGDLFARRLASDGLTEPDLRRVLAAPAAALQARSAPPRWLERLRRAYEGFAWPDPSASGAGEPTFLEVARPLVVSARAEAREALERLVSAAPDAPFAPDHALELLTAHLESKLQQVLNRTLVLELNVARLEGRLAGATPEERFRSFALQLRARDRALALLAEYPVLARQLVRAVDDGLAFYLEFLGRLAADWGRIRAELAGGAEPGPLADVTGGIGDSHRNGRSVLIARFESGFRAVYKPRSLALDVHFQELLGWLDAQGNEPPFRALRVVDAGAHGWVEFVEAQACATPDALDRFYRRQGAYLALLYLLDATDFHTENLMAAGEHPVLLDLEALFHARIGGTAALPPAHRAAARCLQDSVLRIGLLPQRVWAEGDAEGIDLSGLGSHADQTTPFRVPQWRDAGTDEMRLARERVTMPVGQSRPTLDGGDVDVLEHVDAICEGFTRTYELLARRRAELLAPGGPIARFAADEVRTILRPTQTYGVLLRESYHPDVLRDALERTRHFDRLWGQVEALPHLARAAAAELQDLEGGDVPMFTTRPGSRDLWTSGGQRLPDFLEEPSMAHVLRRIEALGPEDLDRQLWFVRASLATASGKPPAAKRAARVPPGDVEVRPAELVEAARAVGEELHRRALREDGVATWMGLSQPGERSWNLAPLNVDLYDGLPGVALFLAHLSSATGEERHAELARAAIAALRQDLEDVREQLTWTGAFSGLGGVLFAFTHLGALWGDRALLDEAGAVARRVPELVARDEHLDVISGAAGCIGALLALHRAAPDGALLDAARRCGERLLETARRTEAGIGWVTPISTERPLSGFSHGSAGMAWALLRLADATGEARFRAAALEAIGHERTLYAPALRNWWDLRHVGDDGAPTHCVVAWCHGAPGIGLARLDTLPLLDDREVRAEIDAAVASTTQAGIGDDHSLCHGALGNVELLSAAARAFGDERIAAAARRFARGVLDDIRTEGWRCGNPLRVESPGLMTGLAGIGWGLLRLADPDRVPSVLLLEPPR